MNADKRDKMVARVQETYKKYPTFLSLPEAEGGDLHQQLLGNDNTAYVNALYQICASGVVTGRRGDEVFGQSDTPSEDD